jgi:uncharacterized repeat protein (TIGR04052 family)
MCSTTIALLTTATLTACGPVDEEPAPEEVEVQFQTLVNGQPFDCTTEYTVGADETSVQFSQMKWFVSDVALIRPDGTEEPLTLAQDNRWQAGATALLDFEDKTGACSNGTEPTRTSVTGTAPEGDYTGLAFTLGVPFDQNHQNPAAAPSPLNLTSMFWNWQGGYKFLRIDGKAAGEAGFRVHLGSTGCQKGDGGPGDVTECTNENRPRVQLSAFDPAADTVVFDIAELLKDVEMKPNSEGKSAVCMAKADHQACEPVFEALGLKFGENDPGEPTVFRAR